MIAGTWAIVEMLGHRRILGQLSEVTVAGSTMLRVDTPSDPPRSVLVAPASLYAITPCDEEHVRAQTAPRPELSAAYDEFVDDEGDDWDDD